MITIVAHFRAQVVKFIFAGRNSGQEQTEAQDGWYSQWPSGSIGLPAKLKPPGQTLSIAALRVVNHHILRDGKYAGLSLELDPVGGVGCKFDDAGFGTKPGDDIPNRTPSAKLGQQQSSVGRVVPYPEFVHGTAQHFLPAISVTEFKRSIHFQYLGFVSVT